MTRLLLLLLCTLVAYSGIRTAGFVWDDIPLIVQNQALVHGSLESIFATDLWADSGAGKVSSGYYRPLVLLSFSLDRAMFGLVPLGYHLHSLLWHLLAVLGLHRLCLSWIGRNGAFVAAAIFALHPVQSEVVVWISARNDLMAAALGFWSLSFVWDGRTPSRWHWFLAMLLSALACLSKESAFVLPLLLWVADWSRSFHKGRLYRCSALGSGVLVVVVVRLIVGVGEGVIPSTEGWYLLANSFVGWLAAMGWALWSPWPISSARDLSWLSMTPNERVLFGIGFWSLLIGLVAWTRRERRGAMLVGFIWLVLLLGVTLVPTADKGGFGDRFLYWPIAGLSVVMGTCCGRWWKCFVPAFVIPAVLVLHLRLPDWIHDRSLWGAAVRDVPTPTNEMSLGHALTLHSRHQRAHVSFVSAIAGNGMDTEACSPVVGSAMRAGLHAHAYRMGRWAIARGCPPNGVMNGWMATAAAMTGDWSSAKTWAESVPDDPKGRTRVVLAALAKRNGNDEQYAMLESQWVGDRPMIEQVSALLNAGEGLYGER